MSFGTPEFTSMDIMSLVKGAKKVSIIIRIWVNITPIIIFRICVPFNLFNLSNVVIIIGSSKNFSI